ncbi:MAG TPA: sigma-70 family RNA polymerase sigma factor [Bryobacteraceae bacterium]|nr:sigma-70 family RNA polymerase sigma factor [Bryobacteraceae bacterium]
MRDYTKLSAEELVKVCADLGNADAWDEFLRRFHPRIFTAVRRVAARYTGPRAPSCDDVAAEVYLRLCAKGAKALRDFVPRHEGSAYGYLSTIAMNTAIDYLGRRPAPPTVEDYPVENVAEPATVEWRMRMRDVDDILRRRVTERERQIFWLYYGRGLTAREIAALPYFGLTLKGVESTVRRLGGIVRKELGTSAA